MLSFTFELIFIASSNSHIIFCLCNFIIAIILLSGFQSSSQDDNTNNILDHDISKRKQAQGNPKATQFYKGMNDLDYQVRKMDTCVTSQEMQTFSISSDTPIIEIPRDINQDKKSEAYYVDASCQYHETADFNSSHYRETNSKSENIEIDTKMDTRATSKEMHTIFISTKKVLKEVNQDNKSEAYNDAARLPSTQSLYQDTNFKGENVEETSAHDTNDTKIYLAKTKKENFEENNEEKEDELRKRIEDFIEKINEGWRAEKLGIFYQSQNNCMSNKKLCTIV